MTTITVHARERTYPVYVDTSLLDSFGAILLEQKVDVAGVVAIVTDETVAALGYAERVLHSCLQLGMTAHVFVVPPGDGTKRLDVVEQLYYKMLECNVRRNGVVVAVGGGVVGDLAGFVAATYQRGVHFIQVPTTLLAHDSSIGGKVGVNLTRGKNLVGAFYPPTSVVYDVDTLHSLPPREWRNGMAEVIKHGLIGHPALFKRLLEKPLTKCPNTNDAIEVLSQAMAVKVDIIQADEHESGRRMALNLGHSVGHAVEQLSAYRLGHGEAIAIGLCVEAYVAHQRGWLEIETVRDVIKILQRHELPTCPPEMNYEEVANCIDVDKKNVSSTWTFALLKGIGQVVIARDVSSYEVRRAWERAKRIDFTIEKGI